MNKFLLFLFLTISFSPKAQEWKFLTPVKSFSIISNLEITPNQTIYMLDQSQNGVVASSKDGGVTWTKLFRNEGYKDIQMLNNNTGFLLTQSGIYKTTNGFATSAYKSANLTSLRTFYFVNESVGFTGGMYGLVQKTLDSGSTYSSINIPDSSHITDLFFLNESIGFACAANGKVYKTTNQGTNWTATSLSNTSINKILFINTTDAFIIGNNGKLFKTTDQGENWAPVTIAATYNLNDIKLNGNQLYIVGDDKRIYRSSDMGQSWVNQRVIDVYPYNSLYSIGFANGNIIVAGDSNIYKSSDAVNWNILVAGVYPSILKSISFANDNQGVVIGSGSTGYYSVVYRSTDGGHSWINQKATFTLNAYNGVHLRENGKGLLIGNGNYALSSDFGQTWGSFSSTNPPTYASAFWLKNNGNILFGTASPYVVNTNGVYSITPPSTSYQFIELGKIETLQFYNDMIGYAGSYQKLYKTTDGGITWNSILDLAQSVNYINIVNANKINIGTNNSQYYTSNNAGTSWTETTNSNNPKYHFINENVGYYFNTNLDLYRTANGGITSQLVAPGTDFFNTYNTNLRAFQFFNNKVIAVGELSDIYIVEFSAAQLGTQENQEIKNNDSQLLYPNPTSSFVFFKTNVSPDKIQVYDTNGRIMKFTKENNGINISNLSEGIYFVKFESNGKWFTQKIIKK